MKIAIHQPEFMPWMGFFNKMALADEYVVFDHVQFKKRYFENRNRLITPGGDIQFLTVPVKGKDQHVQAINNVEIDETKEWKRKFIKTLIHYYGKAPFFNDYFDELNSLIYDIEYTKLISLNMMFINFFRKHLGIHTPMKFSSNMNVSSYKGSDLILQICLLNKADVYLCGPSGRDYLQEEEFAKKGIIIEYIDYQCSYYKQLCDEFIPGLSTLDLLFNKGPESLRIIMNLATNP